MLYKDVDKLEGIFYRGIRGHRYSDEIYLPWFVGNGIESC